MKPVNFRDTSSTDNCGICLESMENEQCIVHSNPNPNMRDHVAFHKKCLKIWLVVKNICPLCHAEVNIDSVFTGKDRVIAELKLMREDAKFIAPWVLVPMIFSALLFTASNRAVPALMWESTAGAYSLTLFANSIIGTIAVVEAAREDGEVILPVRIMEMWVKGAKLAASTLGLGAVTAIGTAVAISAVGVDATSVVGNVAVIVAGIAGHVLSGVITRLC